MAAYSGWGGAANAFSESPTGGWADVSAALRDLLSEDEYAEQRATVLTAFFTPRPVIELIWNTLRDAGVGTDGTAEVLEPGCGTGNFMRCVPDGMDVHVTGIEIDPVSAALAQALCPGHTVVAADIDKCQITDGSFDAAVGNVPYSDAVRIDGVPLHDYMIKRAVSAVRPGGVVALLTSRHTMDKAREATRLGLARECDLVGMARLPRETFESQAGTSALCDLIILRKLECPREIAPEEAPLWVGTDINRDGFRVNALLAQNPAFAVGEQGSAMTGHGPDYSLSSGLDAAGIAAAAADALSTQAVASIRNTFEGMPGRTAAPEVAPVPEDPALYEFTLGDGGAIWYGNGDTVERFRPAARGAEERARAMISLRDASRALIALERDASATDSKIEASIRSLDAAYDRFVERYGRLNEPRNRRILTAKGYHDCSLGLNLFNLEVLDSSKRFVCKADILSRRTVRPQAPMPKRAKSPADALAISYDRTGGVDLDLVGRLLGTDAETAELRLGDLIVRDPVDGTVSSAEGYLSGDIGEKLDSIRELARGIEQGPAEAAEAEWLASASIPPMRTPVTNEHVAAVVDVLKKEGLWDTCVRPLSSTRAVLAAPHIDNLPDGWRDHDFGTWTGEALMAALSELDGDAPVGIDSSRGAKRIANPLIAELVDRSVGYRSNGRDFGGEGMNTEEVLWRLAACPRVSEEALEVALSHAGALSPYIAEDSPIGNLARAYGVPTTREEGARPSELAGKLATAMKADPVPAEYVVHLGYAQAGPDAVRRTVHVDWRGQVEEPVPHGELIDPDDLGIYRGRRETVMSAHALSEQDAERVASIRSIETRLEAALPRELGPSEITATLGSPWIPPSVVMDFIDEKLGVTSGYMQLAKQRRYEVAREALTGRWRVTGSWADLSLEVQARYAVNGYSPLDAIEAALNGTETKIMVKDPVTGKKSADPQATKAAWDRRRAMTSEFEKWVWSDPARAEMLCAIYNRRFNRLSPRKYDGSYLTFPGMNPAVEMRPHQRAAVARAGQAEEGTLVAHVVGAGKTYTGIAMCMEARRLGRATKPLVVVPKHLTEQWASDFAYLYPAAKVLYMGKSDTSSADAVREFWGRAAAGDLDAVIVSNSRFDMLGLSPERQERYLEKRKSEFLEAIKDAKNNGGDFTVKQLERELKKLDRKMETLRGSAKTEGLSFEEIGFDFLFVDEAHRYKNLAVQGLAIAGMGGASAARGEDMLDKCNYLREMGLGRNIVFATGTPVTNTMAELYNMQRYLAPRLLERQGISTFPAWAHTFGQIEDAMEIKPEGNGFQLKQRFTRFHNLPELMGAYHTYADIVTQDDVNLKVPDCEEIHVTVPATPEQLTEVKKLAARGERVRSGAVDATEDNLLAITGDGMKVALDPKLLHPELEPLEDGKSDACAREVLKIWRETADRRGTQLVFCDRSTPASGGWNIQDDMRRRLVEAGIPKDEVACVSDAGDNPERRESLFEKVRAGEVRVLMGSTEKLGTGTNVQTRLAAIHNLDCPWRPSDFEQRLGRIKRQGNTFDTVRDYRYVSQGTFDSFLYSTVERKQRFIGQIFSNKSPVRSMDDIDETRLSFSELAAVASGNPDIKEIQELRSEIMSQSLLRQSHAETVANMRHMIESRYAPAAAAARARVEILSRDREDFMRADVQRTLDKGSGISRAFVGGISAPTRQDAAERLKEAAWNCPIGPDTAIGEYRGLEVLIRREPTLLERGGTYRYDPFVGLRVKGAPEAHWSRHPLPTATTGAHTVIQQMDSLIEAEANGLDAAKETLGRATRQLDDARRVAAEPWEGESGLRKMQERLRELEEREMMRNRADGDGQAKEEGGIPKETADRKETDLVDEEAAVRPRGVRLGV